MAINNNINITLSLIDKVKKPLKDISKGFSGLDKSLRKNKESFQKMAGFGGAAMTGIGYGIKNLVDQASDLEETTQKFNVIYRDLGDAAENAAKDIAKGYGVSQKASKQFLADLGDVTSGFGMSQEASLEYATEVTKLGIDLASFSNIAGGSEEAVDRLNKGFLGEHENLKALGIIINDTMLKKQLLADGTEKLTGLELEQAKISARMTIAISQSTNAIGDFERSKASLANQTRILQANMEDVTTELGQAFLPIITEITTALVPIIQNIASWASENKELVKILGIAAIAITGIVTVLGVLGLVIPAIITGVTALGTALMFLATNPIGLVITAIVAGIAIGILIVKNWDLIVKKAKELGTWLVDLNDKYGWLLGPLHLIIEVGKLLVDNWDSIKAAAVVLGDLIIEVWGIVRDATVEVWDGIQDKVQGVMDFVAKAVDIVKGAWAKIVSIKEKISSSVSGAVSAVTGVITGERALGGTVQSGKTYLVGERGPELFTPSTTGSVASNGTFGGSNGSININLGGVVVNNNADENRLVEKIKTELTRTLQLQKVGIS